MRVWPINQCDVNLKKQSESKCSDSFQANNPHRTEAVDYLAEDAVVLNVLVTARQQNFHQTFCATTSELLGDLISMSWIISSANRNWSISVPTPEYFSKAIRPHRHAVDGWESKLKCQHESLLCYFWPFSNPFQCSVWKNTAIASQSTHYPNSTFVQTILRDDCPIHNRLVWIFTNDNLFFAIESFVNEHVKNVHTQRERIQYSQFIHRMINAFCVTRCNQDAIRKMR